MMGQEPLKPVFALWELCREPVVKWWVRVWAERPEEEGKGCEVIHLMLYAPHPPPELCG